ncbi:hypothetical protein DBT42_09030 [Aerococcus urinae]|nr:hypothetical protein DBT42_09030 [Aerococcus urinae]
MIEQRMGERGFVLAIDADGDELGPQVDQLLDGKVDEFAARFGLHDIFKAGMFEERAEDRMRGSGAAEILIDDGARRVRAARAICLCKRPVEGGEPCLAFLLAAKRGGDAAHIGANVVEGRRIGDLEDRHMGAARRMSSVKGDE